ncbi:MAG: type VI secretion system contractile sheath small subunit [Acidobacteria bacterium]|nr:MAG: type VI secretion system contractile sheath small subunit [Acidobacteriota bacterium]
MASESIQKKLSRVRPPRVRITYDVELGDAVQLKEIPFVVGVLADLSGKPAEPLPRLKDREFIEIDLDNFDEVLKEIKPRLAYRVNNKLIDDDTKLGVELHFYTMQDFEPQQVVNQVEPLRKMAESRRNLSDLLCKIDGNDRLVELLHEVIKKASALQKTEVEQEAAQGDSSLLKMHGQVETRSGKSGLKIVELDVIIAESRIARNQTEQLWTEDLIVEFVRAVLDGTVVVKEDLEAPISARIIALDGIISAQLNEIMHAPEFQKLEASWRGVHYLVSQSETSTMLKIRVLNVSKDDLRKDLERASEFDQSAIFKKVYEEEYGTFGAAPYGALLGDYEFERLPLDMSLLEQISHVAAASHAPFVAAAHPSLLNLDSFPELALLRNLAAVENAKWRSFRESEDSRYVGLAMPHILMRLPYGPDSVPVEGFNFKEHVTEHSNYLWGNAAYAFGTRLTNSFARYGWCAAIRGVEGGGLVEDLPTYTFITDEGEVALKCPTELAITDRREKELSDLGFIPLVHCKGTDYAAFFGAQSCQRPKKFDSDFANTNARFATQLQYIITVSRFAHYLKVMTRDMIGKFASPSDLERYLNRWIVSYVAGDYNASPATKAQYPLREARIDVGEIPGKPGVYKAVVFLRPHFQLEELSISMRMVVELPAPAR